MLALLRSPTRLIARRNDAVLLAFSSRILVVLLWKVQQRYEPGIEAGQRSPQPVREAEESVRGIVDRGRLELAVGALSRIREGVTSSGLKTRLGRETRKLTRL